jgi:bidirectional [NiFe] hydrogenase diaphorase subunit
MDNNKELTRREMLQKLSPLGLVALDRDKCTGCGLCARECPSGALSISPVSEAGTFRLVFRHGDCLACGKCVKVCPEQALHLERTLEPEKLGGEVLLFEDEIIRCSECGAPVGPRRMVEKIRARVGTARSELCIACKARSGSAALIKDDGSVD